MSQPHLIRLRGPWDFRTAGGAVGRISLPSDWLAEIGDATGDIVFTRRFNCPTGLDATSHVTLCWEGLPASASVSLNGQRLLASSQEIQPQARNLIEIAFDSQLPRPVLGEVWLAIT